MKEAAATAQEQEVTFRDRIPTVTEKGKRNWMYVLQPHGKWYRLRSWLSLVYVAAFFSLPFITINGYPALQINLPETKFYFFGFIFWPQDFVIFGLAMVSFVVFIVLFTMIYGRLFCGWACPQTIFMEMIFRRIEWWIEGGPNRQKMLNAKKGTAEYIGKKTLKHVLFFLLSFIIANTFLAYIIGVDQLFTIMSEPVSEHLGGFFAIVAFTGAFYFVYAFVREIVCTVICPYGRLQGVLLDRNSVVVAYDYGRGEPRAKGKRPHEGLGDCVDCHQCVTVCPTGIDIRNGTQLECINCTACIDACNDVMDRVGLKRGLIRYASENELAEKRKFGFTPRMKTYSFVLVLLLGLMTSFLVSRKSVDITVLRTSGQLYSEAGADSLSNLYNVSFLNKTHRDIPVSLSIANKPATIKIIGNNNLVVPADGKLKATVFIVLHKKDVEGMETPVRIAMYGNGKKLATEKVSFLGYAAQ
jgi:cytochrome c oxidase accessory protein FixG